MPASSTRPASRSGSTSSSGADVEFTLLLAALTAVAAVWATARTGRTRLAAVDGPVDAVVGAAAAGMFAGRIAAMVFAGVNPVTSPVDILVVRGGVDPRVAAPAAVLALAWTVRPHIPGALDALAPAALAGLAGWHAGCLWRDACLGTVSDLPWAWAAAGSGLTRHPVELYAAALLAAAAVGVARLPRRPWVATAAAVALAGGARLVTEPLRLSVTGGPVTFYAAAAVVGAAGVLLAARSAVDRRMP